ncbi:MAG: hypothetical protein GC159_16315 [Phycisphaera sp.]|nr:hypothetical protein [Phycisphaera sp.]
MDDPLPYGVDDVEPRLVTHPDNGKVRCVVRSCRCWVEAPSRRGGGESCPQHGIYVHRSGTYRYADQARNCIVDRKLFADRVVGHSEKVGSNRFGMENSEDMLTWNVLRSLMNARHLKDIATMITGSHVDAEPVLYLWGLRVSDDSLGPWELLERARRRFESNLPVDRPLTEPDISLHLPGEYLIHIEAKFTSGNTFYQAGNRRSPHDLTFDELLDIYWDDGLRLLCRDTARACDRIHYQLWRNTVFAEWMAQQDARTTRAYHANLVRRATERDAAEAFSCLLTPSHADRFTQITWEAIHDRARGHESLAALCRYMRNKTAKLHRAFGLHQQS